MCRTGRHKKLCRTCVVNFNLARRPPRPNPNANSSPLGGSRSAGAVTRRTRLRCVFWWRFSKKIPSGRKANLDQNDQHPAQSFAPTSVLLHIGRVLMTNHAYGLIALPERVVCARLPV